MKRTIEFGKIAYYGNRKINAVSIDIELREQERDGEKYEELSICGDIWNAPRTDIVCGGQCLDEIARYIKGSLFKEIYRYWKLYHLNGMHAGTEEQDAAIEAWKAQGNQYDYTKVCDYLKEIGLYEVEYKGKPYRYGSAWLHREIPEADLARIKEIIRKGAEA